MRKADVLALLFAGGFAIGAAFHARDILGGGWMPYRFAPPAMNLFWSLLLPLDIAAAMLLPPRRLRRAGVVLGLAIMAADVAVNATALFILAMPFFVTALALQVTFGAALALAARPLWNSAALPPISAP